LVIFPFYNELRENAKKVIYNYDLILQNQTKDRNFCFPRLNYILFYSPDSGKSNI